MQTVRRLYLYVMSGISLGVLLVGLIILLSTVFHAVGLGPGIVSGGEPNREALSLAAALIVVGLLSQTAARARAVQPPAGSA